MRQIALLLLMMTLSAAAPAKLYKWVDQDGNVTYSERKPPDATVEEVKLKGVAPVSAEQARERLDELKGEVDTVRKDREFAKTVSTENADRDKRLAENCEIARQNLRVLQNASRVQADDGSFLDEKARAARLQRTQQDIDNSCK